ncbi:SAM-dependent methyltransferase [Pseudoroseomonas rhizosphaerae]|uniref:SAM-dependent methyltransferase n=1 Tax=Teichococcus rhizosphaerae TaxID=1335062 RepID=A0A2C7AJ83_9PROT|nr:class I SAM-dependent methyltransferase [Pseudoroseomonas rhizosphaerae]PHK96827.1 SAM-dependent methyltransferase [Pseudoroseomonas rhizosphaerae]
MNRMTLLASACLVFLWGWQSTQAQPAQAQPAQAQPAQAQPAPVAPTPAAPDTYKPTVGQMGKDVVWVPTHQALVDRMLDMAKVTPQDYLVDLGSGDGRTVITAAKRGVRAHGIEYNPDLVAVSRRAAQAEGVAERATFAQADIFQSDFSDATVVTLFLLHTLNERLRPTLLAMRPGTRVVSNTFTMGDWEADQQYEHKGECSSFCRAYLWIIPADAAGEWRLGEDRLVLRQTYQMLSGTLTRDGQELPITEAKMDGNRIAFTAGNRRYTGELAEGRITGRTEDGAEWSATRAPG